MNDSGSSRALADLVARIGDAAFADQLMLVLHHLCAADMCSGFVISGGKARAMFAVSIDPKRSAFARIATLRYARKYWKRDTAAAATLGRAHRSAQTTRRPSSVIRDLDYRVECYAEGDVIERISVCKAGDIQIIANAYRQRASGPFSQQHIERFEAASPIVIAAIDKHLRLTRLSRGVAAMPGADAIATRLRGIESTGLSMPARRRFSPASSWAPIKLRSRERWALKSIWSRPTSPRLCQARRSKQIAPPVLSHGPGAAAPWLAA